ncbi:hypothetical protein D3C87_2089360 [compost metagenome]
MSLLFTVAMVTVSAAWQSRAEDRPADRKNALGMIFIVFSALRLGRQRLLLLL